MVWSLPCPTSLQLQAVQCNGPFVPCHSLAAGFLSCSPLQFCTWVQTWLQAVWSFDGLYGFVFRRDRGFWPWKRGDKGPKGRRQRPWAAAAYSTQLRLGWTLKHVTLVYLVYQPVRQRKRPRLKGHGWSFNGAFRQLHPRHPLPRRGSKDEKCQMMSDDVR